VCGVVAPGLSRKPIELDEGAMLTAEPVRAAAEIRDLLARQVRSPVEWVGSVRRMVSDGVDTFVECGPGGALTGMVRRIAPAARTLTVFDPESLAESVSVLLASGVAVAV